MTTRRSFRLATLCVFLFGLTSLASAVDGCSFDPETDIENPIAYLNVDELDKAAVPHGIVWQSKGTGTTLSVLQALDVEVDDRSLIRLRFNRDVIKACKDKLNLSITIKAQVKSTDGVREIEVPGYSLIGQQQATALVQLRSAEELVPALTRLKQDLRTGTTTSAAVPNSKLSIFAQLRNVTISPADAQATAKDALDEDGDAIQVALRKMADPRNFSVLQALAATAKPAAQDPDIIVAEAHSALNSIGNIAKATAGGGTASGADLEKVYIALRDLTSLIPDNANTDEIVERLMTALKDSAILVTQTGAKVGDQIIITVTNGTGIPTPTGAGGPSGTPGQATNAAPDNTRELTLSIRVAEFGWNKTISDSALLLYRLGISAADNAAVVSAGRARATTTNQVVTVETPDAVNYVPAPGVTLGITLSERRGTTFGDKLARFFEPGVGINLSFPVFSTTVSTITPVSGGQPSVTTTTTKNTIDVGVGVVASLWSNAVQFTYGWNLNVTNHRPYIGLGFGFVKVIEKIKSLSSS